MTREEFYEPRHPEGTCINLQPRESTEFIEYIAPDESDRAELVENYDTAVAVSTQLQEGGRSRSPMNRSKTPSKPPMTRPVSR